MSYKVLITSSHHEFDVESNETLLDAGLKQGYIIPYGCRSGKCGMCKAKVITGSTKYEEVPTIGLNKINPAQGEILLCQAYANSDLTLEVREIERKEEIEVRKTPCRIAKMQRLSHDVMEIFLKLPDSERLQFKAGQYIDFILQDGRRRSFSLANAPTNDELLELHVRKVEGGFFTTAVFETMHEKDILRIEGPFGQFYLRQETQLPIIFVAGGTGFAPVKGMIEQAITEKMQRPMYLYWGVRAKHDLYMHNLAQQWADDHSHIHYIPVLSDPLTEDHWQGRTGFVHEAVLQDISDFTNYEVYACGPPMMISATENSLIERGLTKSRFFYDSFEFATDQH